MTQRNTRATGAGLNYSAQDLAAFKKRHGITDITPQWDADYQAALARIAARKQSADNDGGQPCTQS
jgi:hypothetical protein